MDKGLKWYYDTDKIEKFNIPYNKIKFDIINCIKINF